MTRQRIEHAYFRWVDDLQEPTECKLACEGHLRFVHARRARKLRKRGVPLLQLQKPNGHIYYMWWETPASYDSRFFQRRLTKALMARLRRKAVPYNAFGLRSIMKVVDEAYTSMASNRAVFDFFRPWIG